MPERLAAKILDVLRQVAPGMPLRDGLDRIIQGSKGALIVVGDGPNVLSICSGGFLLDAAYSPQRLQELLELPYAAQWRKKYHLCRVARHPRWDRVQDGSRPLVAVAVGQS